MTPEVLCLGRSDLIATIPKWIAAVCVLRIPLFLDVFFQKHTFPFSVCHDPFCTSYPLVNHVPGFTEKTFAMCADTRVGCGPSCSETVLA